MAISIWLPSDVEARLQNLATLTGRSKTSGLKGSHLQGRGQCLRTWFPRAHPERSIGDSRRIGVLESTKHTLPLSLQGASREQAP